MSVTSKSSAQIIATLQRHISDTVPLAAEDKDYCLLDFPDYSNVGDSLIWLGAAKFLADKYGAPPRYSCTIHNFDPVALRRQAPKGPIYLSGGGNFGDLWPKFQNFRLAVLRAFPDRHIIQLPQTIHFADPANARSTREAIRNHGNFTLLVRDKPSFDFAHAHLDLPAVTAPDMAFWLGRLPSRVPPAYDLALMLRTDKERNERAGIARPPQGLRVNAFDWIEGGNPTFLMRLLVRGERQFGIPSRQTIYKMKANMQLNRGLDLLGSGRMLVTDRLHGHILATLMDIPHVLLDNSYGKLKNFHALWTAGSQSIHLATTLDEAFHWIEANGQTSGSRSLDTAYPAAAS